MICAIVGSIVLLGVFKVARYRRWRRWAMMNGYDPAGGPGWGRHGRRGLFGLLQRLNLTPDQKASFREARSEMKDAATQIRETLAELRHDVALALSAPAFEEELVGATTVKLDAAVDTLRKTLVSLVGRAHATLDENQRLELARVLEQSGRPAAAFL